MFVKYPMQNVKDYRGNVTLVVRNGGNPGAEVAYSSVETADPDMIELSDEEVELVKSKAKGGYKAEIARGAWATKREEFKLKIDLLADEIRRSHLEAGFATVDLEYLQVEMELDKWEKKGKPTTEVPPDITVWQEVTGQDLEWTTNDIKAAINNYRHAISEIRRVRLKGKRDISQAIEADVDDVYLQAYADLEALRLVPAPTE